MDHSGPQINLPLPHFFSDSPSSNLVASLEHQCGDSSLLEFSRSGETGNACTDDYDFPALFLCLLIHIKSIFFGVKLKFFRDEVGERHPYNNEDDVGCGKRPYVFFNNSVYFMRKKELD